jgi:Stage II sporulation protein E (SpoIIE)/GAF domain
MAGITLKNLVGPRSSNFASVQAIRGGLGDDLCLLDSSGEPLAGENVVADSDSQFPVQLGEVTLGFVRGPQRSASALASLLSRIAVCESESRALGAEVLQLYREINVIERLSEDLAPLIDLVELSRVALAQAHRLIPATHGGIFISTSPGLPLEKVASFEDSEKKAEDKNELLGPQSEFFASILERDLGEIVNDCATDPRALDGERSLQALICAPLRAGQRSVGVIALGSILPGASYSAANLKLINTIALQAAAAIENAILCARMIETARDHAALEAELHAASTVQQLLLQSASSATPGFTVDSVYLPASEVGGDFFLVSTAPDGALTAIVGDVSGKGLTAAMRVAMILGALRRERSDDPSTILSALNNTLINSGDFGFTTMCCVRISLSGEFALANGGHIAPYVSGREIQTPDALPLGIIPDQVYETVSGRLGIGERLVLMSDGIPEARSESGDLYGFERLSALTMLSAEKIAKTAHDFGQEDDITVLTVALSSD